MILLAASPVQAEVCLPIGRPLYLCTHDTAWANGTASIVTNARGQRDGYELPLAGEFLTLRVGTVAEADLRGAPSEFDLAAATLALENHMRRRGLESPLPIIERFRAKGEDGNAASIAFDDPLESRVVAVSIVFDGTDIVLIETRETATSTFTQEHRNRHLQAIDGLTRTPR